MTARVRRERERRGLTQAELASAAGVGRQALVAIESGAQAPGVRTALALARALETTCEALFGDVPSASVRATAAVALRAGERVVLAEVRGRVVAHAAARLVGAAHGLAGAACAAGELVDVERLRPAPAPPTILAGCAQALGVLADRLRASGRPALWVHANSATARRWLAAGLVHGAQVHAEGPAVPRGLGARAGARGLDLGTWELGLVVAPRARAPRDLGAALARPARFVGREASSSAAETLERVRRRARLAAPRGLRVALGHDDAAALVRADDADAALANRPAATALGLGFVPLARERVALWFARDDDGAGGAHAACARELAADDVARELAAMGHGATEHLGCALGERATG